MRGEHLGFNCGIADGKGSPPHARGTCDDLVGKKRKLRITPACAGNISIMRGANPRPQDHPRMRGEHYCEGCECADITGSPPHARGTSMIYQV